VVCLASEHVWSRLLEEASKLMLRSLLACCVSGARPKGMVTIVAALALHLVLIASSLFAYIDTTHVFLYKHNSKSVVTPRIQIYR
jgi:hypothetical protein